ncbi:hypothetical protein [Actinoplanes sp. M2I2]|uniref:hypothetical protein n=1 Tax=Actinoplanes sp. M2I2 TaxID=1734444 RepID=UPI002021F4B3|nr:hypothetical protein [Actinoplanes sp. M2I2]
MRRSMFLLAAAATLAATFAAPATASAAESCVAASSATYRHTFDGASGKATITAVRRLCPGQTQSFGLVSYTAGAATGNAGQFRYATDRATITSTSRSVDLDAVVPPCYTQVTAITGTALQDEVSNGDNPYGAKTLGAPGSRSTGPRAHYRGGSAECTTAPQVTFASACDGSYRATLTNAPEATVSAAFLINGRLTRLAPGRSTTVPGPTGGSLTIRDNTFTTYVGSWRPPASGCTAAPAPPPSAPAAPTTRPSTDKAPSPGATPAPTATTTPTTDAANAPAFYFTPPATATAEPQAAPAGMSTGSMLAVAFGLLLIGGGGYFLYRVLRTLRDPS